MEDNATPITIAYGDGVGPEIMEACLHILREAGANLSVESIEVGERIYKQGAKDGLLPKAWNSLRRTGILFLGPVIVPDHEKCEPLGLALSQELGMKSSRPYDPNGTPHLPEAFGYQTAGESFALFSATEPAQQKLTGKDVANPSALLQAAIMMMRHIDQEDIAQRVEEAWKKTLKEGIHTKDVYGKGSKEKVGTEEFAQAVLARLTW